MERKTPMNWEKHSKKCGKDAEKYQKSVKKNKINVTIIDSKHREYSEARFWWSRKRGLMGTETPCSVRKIVRIKQVESRLPLCSANPDRGFDKVFLEVPPLWCWTLNHGKIKEIRLICLSDSPLQEGFAITVCGIIYLFSTIFGSVLV